MHATKDRWVGSEMRRWLLRSAAALGLLTACLSSSPTPPQPHPSQSPSPLRPESAQAHREAEHAAPVPAAPVPAPLAEIDAEAVAALPAPAPREPEPPPFDDEQLHRIDAVQSIVHAAANTHGVDPTLINAVIWVESKFDRRARGPAGAQGLMQLMPKTAAGLAKQLGRKRDSYDPDFNIHAGTLLLAQLLARFDGDVTLALAGYNRGAGTVAKWVAAGQPLPEGTQGFVHRVLTAKTRFERLATPASPSP
jgi:soluble lytic murein transglycosylase-like protein